MKSFTKVREAANNAEVKEIEKRQEEMFEVEQRPLFYTRARQNYHENPWSKRQNQTIAVGQAVAFGRRGHLRRS